AAADVLRSFELIEQGDRVIFHRDRAVSLRVDHETLGVGAIAAGALAGLDDSRGAEVRPIEASALAAKDVERWRGDTARIDARRDRADDRACAARDCCDARGISG